MSGPFHDRSWYRAAALRPRLSTQAVLERRSLRGEIWWVLHDQASERTHRLSEVGYTCVGLMNGQRTVEEIWAAVLERHGEQGPTQPEFLRLLGELHEADLLRIDGLPSFSELTERGEKRRRSRWLQRWTNPMSIRVPLFDPDRLLDRYLPLYRFCFTWPFAMLALATLLFALSLAAIHWQELTENLADRVLAPSGLVLLGVIFPIVKAVHEFAHACAVKRWGGEVHEMGVMLLVLMPVPYVDASAANRFREPHRRVVVGAAGMLAEVFLAAAAMVLWRYAEPGFVRAIAFDVMLIAGISTVVFNGNPLLRFDGYYILQDLIGIPNLGPRAQSFLTALWRRNGLGEPGVSLPELTPGERAWFIGYGVASYLYRMVVGFGIALLVASQFFGLGLLVAAWLLTMMVLRPLAGGIHFLLTSPTLEERRPRAVTAALLVGGGLFFVLALWPLPYRSLAEGVVWVPDEADLRMPVDGFVERVDVSVREQVSRGQALLRAVDPELDTQVEKLTARVRGLEARLRAGWIEDAAVQREIIREELQVASQALAQARDRLAELQVSSSRDALAIMPNAPHLPGRFLHKGERIGFLLRPGELRVRMVVPQVDVTLVRQRLHGVEVRLARDLALSVPAKLVREVPSASREVPSPALTQAGGGRFANDPGAEGASTVFEEVFQFELTLPGVEATDYIGGRVHVRLDHGHAPLVEQWYRHLRALFLDLLHG